MPSKKTTAALAHYAEKEVTPVINDFANWIEREVGVTLTGRERSVLLLGSSLRGIFQKSESNQKRLAEVNARVAAAKVAREERAAARVAKVAESAEPKRQPATKPATPAAPVANRRRPLKVEAAQ